MGNYLKIILVIVALGLSIATCFEKTYIYVSSDEYIAGLNSLSNQYWDDENFDEIRDEYLDQFHQVGDGLYLQETNNLREGLIFVIFTIVVGIYVVEDMLKKE